MKKTDSEMIAKFLKTNEVTVLKPSSQVSETQAINPRGKFQRSDGEYSKLSRDNANFDKVKHKTFVIAKSPEKIEVDKLVKVDIKDLLSQL